MSCGNRATGNICAAKVRIRGWRRRGGGNVACADDELSWIVGRLDGEFRNRAGAELGGGVRKRIVILYTLTKLVPTSLHLRSFAGPSLQTPYAANIVGSDTTTKGLARRAI